MAAHRSLMPLSEFGRTDERALLRWLHRGGGNHLTAVQHDDELSAITAAEAR